MFRCHANEEDESQDINTVFVRFGFQTDTAKCIFFDVDLIRLDFIFLPKIKLKTCRKGTTLSWFYCVNCMHFESKVQWKMELFE